MINSSQATLADNGRPLRPSSAPPGFWLRSDLDAPLATRDVAAMFRALQSEGLSQRCIASLTGQRQSEVHEIMCGGRRVRDIHVLQRIADGLGVPRERMKLATGDTPPTLPSAERARGQRSAPRIRQALGLDRPRVGPVFVWTGVEVRVLRQALRMSVREFAAHLGVSDRMVSKWEAGGSTIQPRPMNQAALDTCLNRAPADAQARFALWPGRTGNAGVLVQAPRWVAHIVLDVSTLDAAVQLAQKVVSAAGAIPHLVNEETVVSPEDRPSHRFGVFNPAAAPAIHDGSR